MMLKIEITYIKIRQDSTKLCIYIYIDIKVGEYINTRLYKNLNDNYICVLSEKVIRNILENGKLYSKNL